MHNELNRERVLDGFVVVKRGNIALHSLKDSSSVIIVSQMVEARLKVS
jgi:hypothetical protein